MFPDDESVARAANEQETPDAVEVAQGPVEERWQHVMLAEDFANPYIGSQVHVWIDNRDEEVTIRSYEWVDVRQIQLAAPAMEKLVDAWLARHPRELSFEQVSAYMNALPFSVIASMTLDYTGVPDAPALDLAD